MITRQCCAGGPASRRSARRLSTAAASILPGAALLLLPKCPLCLAAWLTVVTGVGFSASGAAWTRGMLVVFWIAAVTLALTLFKLRKEIRRPDSQAVPYEKHRHASE